VHKQGRGSHGVLVLSGDLHLKSEMVELLMRGQWRVNVA
jgi:hypothetical protein